MQSYTLQYRQCRSFSSSEIVNGKLSKKHSIASMLHSNSQPSRINVLAANELRWGGSIEEQLEADGFERCPTGRRCVARSCQRHSSVRGEQVCEGEGGGAQETAAVRIGTSGVGASFLLTTVRMKFTILHGFAEFYNPCMERTDTSRGQPESTRSDEGASFLYT
jgi:hypothetical protein